VGALQSICYQDTGKKVVRDHGAIPSLVTLLGSQAAAKSIKVKTRAVGALHNLSTDVGSIRLIRGCQGIPILIDLLKAPEPVIAGSAAGAIQNMSREDVSRKLVMEGGAVEPLTTLLVCPDVSTQVCALGALMNILGPTFGPQAQPECRKAFRSLLTTAIASGIIFHGMFSPPEKDDGLAPM
jgi:hypothetical protein